MEQSVDLSKLQRSASTRSAATVRKMDRLTTRFAEKKSEDDVRRLFDLGEEESLVSSHPCWLFRSIQLHGMLYLFTTNICFHARLPPQHDRHVLVGKLHQEVQRGFRSTQHYAILRSTTLCWYESEKDPFFPQEKIDLRDVYSVDEEDLLSGASGEPTLFDNTRFSITTRHRTFQMSSVSSSERNEWVSALRKAVFAAQNEGESVSIVIPVESVLDVDHSEANPLSGHTSAAEQEHGVHDVAIVAVKVINSAPGDAEMTMDEYFFTNMADESKFVQYIRKSIAAINQAQQSTTGHVRETIGAASLQKQIMKSTTASRLTSVRESAAAKSSVDSDVATVAHIESKLADAALSNLSQPLAKVSASSHQASPSSSIRTLKLDDHAVYPPNPLNETANSRSAMPNTSVPLWLRNASSMLTSNAIRSVREIWSAHPNSAAETVGSREQNQSDSMLSGHFTEESLEDSMHSSYSILEREQAVDYEEESFAEAKEQFRQVFSLPDSEHLLTHARACLYRFLPVMGRLYISSYHVCFRSSSFFNKTMGKTLMILPHREIISVTRNNAVQYGRFGLVIIVRGHEEIFLEFNSAEQRDHCVSAIEYQANQEAVHTESIANLEEKAEDTTLFTDAIPADFDVSASGMLQASRASLLAPPTAREALKPGDGLHFTVLTIGSRGDVQPYIALAKGLQREGHHVRIATHEEFEKWIRSYDIDFYAIGGDPAELMRICVENGTFTLAFVRESVTHFRGWLDDLLHSSWRACQGTDVIIESPSAMAGIHIAEALRIPYYRAFTMPWTRTRAYPHAFAVPSGRAGGNYNYMSYVIFDQVLWRTSAGQINSWRSRCLGLKATNMELLRPHEVPFLYNFSSHLVPRPLDWADWVHITGFWFLDNADTDKGKETWSPSPELTAFIDESRHTHRKLAYIGWGSIVIKDADEVLSTVIEAVRMSGVRAIISLGWSDRLKARRADTNVDVKKDLTRGDDDVWRDIFFIDSVPHDWLFPQVDVACHHGGSGTLGASLRAGKPTIVKPFFGDQFFWAKQVENLQIGQSLNGPFTSDRFAAALSACASSAKMHNNARRLADRIAKEDGVGVAIQAIYNEWDRALGRIGTLSASLDERGSAALLKASPADSSVDSVERQDEGEDDGWYVVSGGATQEMRDDDGGDHTGV